LKSAFIALLGSPNVGKSTLLNAFIGRKIAIVTKKAQTTRNRITGILTTDTYQMVFVDTPGIMQPKNKLGEFMVKTAESVAKDVDVVLFLADAKTGARERDQQTLANLAHLPVIIAVNKTDAVDDARIQEVENSLRVFDRPMFRVSAKTGAGVDLLLKELEQYLVDGPQFYPQSMVTDQPESFTLAEIIREKALKGIGKEIPHGIGVEIEKHVFDDQKKIYHIDAVIYCEKDSHKGIVIGKGGAMLKKLASAARKDMEELLGHKVFLQVFVKVKPDWRNKPSILKTLGYREE
jgi:GTP-binding protein Era